MIALDPSKTTWIQLPEHKDKPDAPAFKVRFASCRTMDDFCDLLDKAREEKRDKLASSHVTQALEMVVVGWRNMPTEAGEFGPGALDRVLTWLEKWQLAWVYPSAVALAESDAKKSGSQPPSAGAESAAVVPAAAG